MSRTFVRVDSLQNLKRLARQGTAFKNSETIQLLDRHNVQRACTRLNIVPAGVGFILDEDDLLAAGVEPSYYRGDYLVARMPASLFSIPTPLADILRGVEVFGGYTLSLSARDVYPKLEVLLSHHGKRVLGVEVAPDSRLPLQRSQLVCSCGTEPASGWCGVTREKDRINGWGQMRDVRGDLAQGLAQGDTLDPLTAAVLLEPMASYIDSVLAWFRGQSDSLFFLTRDKEIPPTEPLPPVVKAWSNTVGGSQVRARRR